MLASFTNPIKISVALLIFTAVALTGCATTQGQPGQAKWVGKNIAQVIEAWGQPQDKSVMSDGSTQWVFKKQKTGTMGDQAPVHMVHKQRTETYLDSGVWKSRQVDYDEPEYDRGAVTKTDCEARFITKDDVVTSATFKGNGCG